ncbi:MAG: cyclic nucleotide-binding domain-containing protein [Rhodospirillaceae bacterium]|nr:MAG: cyclic nucleotide-binding domain-containing protein [Rhodospirillaceae bacterium]
MAEFGPRSLEKVVAFIGERDDQTRKELHQILTRAGVKMVSAQDNLPGLIALIGKIAPDLIMVGDDLDPKIFDFIRDIRHNKLGTNPFVLVTTLVAPERAEAVKRALQSGTDDIIVKPVKEDQLLQRLRRVTLNRQAFVVTSDYLGPDRRGKGRPSKIRRINVLNTMLEKASGQTVDAETMRVAVDNSMNEVLHGRLDSHGYRLSFVCDLIIGAYESKNVTPEVREKLLVLVDVLKDAARTAHRLKETELAILCGSLTKQVLAIADHYETPTDADMELLHKINKAVVAAVKPRASAEQLQQEAEEGAKAYQQRDREEFASGADIQRSANEPPVDMVDEPVIEILPLPKGKYLFRQGDPATAAYIVTSGVIAIYKEKDGQRLPIAKVRKGEFFGEMAIVDGTQRRASAFALEDSTLSLVAKDMIEQKMSDSDPLVRSVVQMLINSLRMVHDVYTPKSRHVSDSVREIKEQVATIVGYVESPTAPAGLKGEGASVAAQLKAVTDEMVNLIERHPDLDPRTPALPADQELPARP